MFFVGPSANIFVYLLVSAFFVICFYSRGETKLPEALPGYENVVSYKVSEDEIYYCQTAENDHFTVEKETSRHIIAKEESLKVKPSVCFSKYKDPNLSITTLRAPPSRLIAF